MVVLHLTALPFEGLTVFTVHKDSVPQTWRKPLVQCLEVNKICRLWNLINPVLGAIDR